MTLDEIDRVKAEAESQGIPLSQVTIIYEDPATGKKTLGSFTETGEAPFPENITGFHYLGAD